MDNGGKMNRRRFFRTVGLGAVFTVLGLNPVRALAAAEPDPDTEVNLTIDLRDSTMNVIKRGTEVGSRMFSPAGFELVVVMMEHMKSAHNLLIGRRTAAKMIMEIGSALPLMMPVTRVAKGRNMISGLPQAVTVDDEEIRDAIDRHVKQLVSDVALNMKYIIEPDMIEFVATNGILLKGEFGKLKRLDERLQQATGFKFTVV